MALKIGQKVLVEAEFLDSDETPTQELDQLPVFTLLDPSLGELQMIDAFKGYYIPSKTGPFKISVLAKDGGVDLMAEGEDVVGGKDAVKAKLKFSAPEPV